MMEMVKPGQIMSEDRAGLVLRGLQVWEGGGSAGKSKA